MAHTAVLAGDPCFDRILDAVPRREAFRRRFGVGPGQRLVVLNSTWGRRSLFGSDELSWLLAELVGALPADEYRVCAVLHPNIWHGHGPGQVRRWLRTAQDSGLLLVPPLGAWRQALVAADCVIGDHGSVTYYAAALGTPVLLGAFPEDDLDPASPVAELGRTAARLHPYEPLRPQLERTLAGHIPGRYDALGAQTTSAPGESAGLLRQMFYDLMGRSEPERPALLERLGLPGADVVPVTEPLRVLTQVRTDVRTDVRNSAGQAQAPEISVTRYVGHSPAGSDALYGAPYDAHTAVHEDTRDPTRLTLADLVLGYAPEHPAAWTADALRQRPYAAMAVAVTGTDNCLVRTGDGRLATLNARSGQDGYPDPCDPAVYASALHAWLESGRPVDELAVGMTVVTGRVRHHITVAVTSPPPTR
ncbi:hypothetical protein [Streptomyces spiramyceticus]|uniref:hypothetical protein n=1 Tax=Streptomyces spiramyceticus TaxID=299717 RepID=UPI00237BF060|nr:hypothetical protein [Streptomyces spiramyceticus]